MAASRCRRRSGACVGFGAAAAVEAAVAAVQEGDGTDELTPEPQFTAWADASSVAGVAVRSFRVTVEGRVRWFGVG